MNRINGSSFPAADNCVVRNPRAPTGLGTVAGRDSSGGSRISNIFRENTIGLGKFWIAAHSTSFAPLYDNHQVGPVRAADACAPSGEKRPIDGS
jgi:hypothetical protein